MVRFNLIGGIKLSMLLMVRHGETELKSSERLWGRTDVKLDRLGLKQAERLCQRLAEEKIDVIFLMLCYVV